MWQCANYIEEVGYISYQQVLHLKAYKICQDRLPALRSTLCYVIRMVQVTQTESPGCTSLSLTYRRYPWLQ